MEHSIGNAESGNYSTILDQDITLVRKMYQNLHFLRTFEGDFSPEISMCFTMASFLPFNTN